MRVLFISVNLKIQLTNVFAMPGAKAVVGCFVGGMKETQDMLNFAAEHNITADIETISIDNANTALERLEKGDVRYRFVIDVGNTLKSSS